jgi:hypothetical protein
MPAGMWPACTPRPRSMRGSVAPAGVKHAVLLSDMRVLPLVDACAVDRLRYSECARFADAEAAAVGGSQDLPAADAAPDVMGAAVRAALNESSAWRVRVRELDPILCAARATPSVKVRAGEPPVAAQAAAAPRLAVCPLARNGDVRAAVRAARGAAWVASARPSPVQPAQSSRERVLRRRAQPSQQYNPVQDILSGQATPRTYLAAPDCVAPPLLALRSAHFRGDHTSQAGTLYKADRCPCCQTDLVGVAEDVSADKRRWRLMQHALVVCTGPAGVLSALRGALRQDVLAALPGTQAAQAAARAVLVSSQEAEMHVQQAFVSFLLDPGTLCRMPSPAMQHIWIHEMPYCA